MRRAGTVLAAAALAILIAAPGASATVNRAEYQAQVNPICANANREAERVISVLIGKLKRLEKKDKGNGGSVVIFPASTASAPAAAVAATAAKKGKKGKRKNRQDPFTRLFDHFTKLLLSVDDSELASLRQIVPAPGDEALVADWLGARGKQIELYRELIRVEKKIEKLLERGPSGKSLKGFLRWINQLERLERRADKIYVEGAAAFDTDIELGARLGASYCVTDATGPTS